MTSEFFASTDGRRISKVIFEYARHIGREQDKEKLLTIIADMGRDLVQADRCSIWLLDEAAGCLVTRVAHGTDQISIAVGKGLVGQCVVSGQPVLANTTQGNHQFSGSIDDRTGYQTKSVLAVPLKGSDGKTIGAFQALNKPGGFVEADADLMSLAAAYSASTIETQSLLRRAEEARRMVRELEIAREVQQRLMPGDHLPQINGVDFAGLCRPASEVGGDYYGFLPLPNGRVMLALGDVSGKGIAAALMMASVLASFQGLILQAFASLSDLVDRLNRIVYECSTSARYSTLFIAEYDPTKRILNTVNAGHVSPFLIRRDGRIEKLDSDGPPVGLLPNARFQPKQSILDVGDTVLIYSDGFSDCEDPNGKMWEGNGFEAAAISVKGTAAEVVRQLLECADKFADGSKQFDDMTAVCLRAISLEP